MLRNRNFMLFCTKPLDAIRENRLPVERLCYAAVSKAVHLFFFLQPFFDFKAPYRRFKRLGGEWYRLTRKTPLRASCVDLIAGSFPPAPPCKHFSFFPLRLLLSFCRQGWKSYKYPYL